MKIKFDVTPKELNIIQDIFSKHLCDGCSVWVFGSRAKNTSLFNSDLDLAIECKDKVDLNKFNKIKSDLEFSRLPYTVDLIDINAVKTHFKDLIQSEMIAFPLKKNSNIPKLRFKEFSGEWERKKLSSFSSKCNEKNKDVSITGVLTNSAVNGIVAQKDFFDKDIANQNNLAGYYIVNNNDFVYNPRISSSASVGPLNRNHLQTGVMSPLYTVFSINDDNNISLDYLERYFKASKWYEYMYSIANYGARSDRMNVTNNDFFSMPIPLPTKPEQQKIASFITSVDKKIELLTEKEKLLKDYKKGIMQKIFSQEIRFKADDGSEFPKWVEKRLGDIGKFTSGTGFPEKEQGGRIGVPFFKVSDMNLPANIVTMQKAKNYVTDEQIINMKLKPIRSSSIIFAKVGAAIFLERKRLAKNFLLDNNMMSYTPMVNIDFIYQWINRVRLSKFAQVGALPSYNSSDLKTIKIAIPCSEEQTKIVNFLSAIDSKIEQVTKQLEHTKEFKKGLLQQMFV